MRHQPQFKTMGVVLLVLGIFIQYLIRRRKFNRRSSSGSERFRSYETSVITRFFEGIFGLISIAMILAGGILLAGAYF